jgi:hypothetical protein
MKHIYWDYFDKWYIITLKGKNIDPIIKNLKKVGITNYEILRFTPADKTINVSHHLSLYDLVSHNTWDETAENIGNNHMSVIKKGIQNNFDNIVILEDDAMFFTPHDTSKLKEVIKWLKNNIWDIFYFGHCPWPIPLSYIQNLNIVRTYSPLLAHCYCLSKQGMKNALKYKRQTKIKQIDQIYADSSLKMYAIYPSISYQETAPAIYKEIVKRTGINVDFNNLVYILETLAILIPIIVLSLIIYKILSYLRSKHNVI